MVILGGWVFFMSQVPLYSSPMPRDLRQSYGGWACSYERGTPVPTPLMEVLATRRAA